MTAARGRRTGTLTSSRSVAVVRAGRVLGALLTLAMGWIHLQLWFDGFRDVRIVGVLFLLNVLGAAVLTVALLAVRGDLVAPVAALGALFTAGTLAALIVSLTAGLFGVQEIISARLVPTTLVVEAAGAIVLAATAFAARQRR